MKNYLSIFILILIDIVNIVLTIILAYYIRYLLSPIIGIELQQSLTDFLNLWIIYIFILSIFIYEGIYIKRFDFWNESKIIIKSILFSFILVMAYLSITQSVGDFSRVVIIILFLILSIIIPTSKIFIKKLLFKLNLWQREAKVYSNNIFLEKEIFNNYYLGYVKTKNSSPKTIFINSSNYEVDELNKIINREIDNVCELIFIPLINNYDLTHSDIYNLFNTKTNLIVFQNRLKSKYRTVIKKIFDFFISIVILPSISPILIYITYKIYKNEPNSPIFFKQKRLGKNSKVFMCYKFRTMYHNSDNILEKYLKDNPNEITYYEKYHKYKNDPRITTIGNFLRKSSLDELPQIINILKGEMSLIGPRPYMIEEENKIGKNISNILSVKPGITGLWQVSGRSGVDFDSRVNLDIWYVKNWSLWLDIIILFKTIKVVIKNDGAS